MKKYFKTKVEQMQGKVRPQILVVNSALNPGSLVLSIGLLLATFGLGVILFPKFFAVLFGIFFLTFGAVFTVLAYKLIKFKKNMEARFKDLSKHSAIVVQHVNMSDGNADRKEFSEDYIEVGEDKKITWH